jgi:formyl-CoA transferase
MSGLVNITGFAGEPPVHAGFSNGDSVTGLMGAFAIQAALYRKAQDPSFQGEWIDLALYEALFRLVEWQVVLYDQLGIVPERICNKLVVAPASVVGLYRTSDSRWLTVTSGTPRSVMKVASLVGEPPEDYATRELQKTNIGRLDSLLGRWIGQRTLADCMETIRELEVVASPIYTVKDMMEDPTYIEREDIVTVQDPELGPMRMQGVVPRLANHGGSIWRTGPGLGEDTDLVFGEWLGKPRGSWPNCATAATYE